MRVIAGELKGRTIYAPPGSATRPTADRVREALFSALTARIGNDFSHVVVLDAFAGSGALGIEALSRGARAATFVERDARARDALRRSITELGLTDRARVLATDVFAAVRSGRIGPDAYSLLFLDPPYRINKSEVTALVRDLGARGALAEGATIVWEHGASATIEWPDECVVDSTKKYGSTMVDIARWRGEGGQG